MFNNSFSIFTQIYDDSTSTGLKVNFRLSDKSYMQFNSSGVWINNLHTLNSTTITHYCPIEGNIEDFKLGFPVFMSGNVYKRNGNEWIPSTNDDTEDCICSVVNTGDHKTFVGVITKIDEKNNSLWFASHGDFLFSVDDSTDYEIGDVILYNGMILDEDITLTLKHQRSIVGVVSAIIDKHTVSIFRE